VRTADEADTHPHHAMLTATALVIWKLLLPLLVLVALIDWLTASTDRRVLVLRRAGLSQRQIADRLNLTRYRVRRALA
jgi:DNA-binding NarL/FixJ family response regulator